MTRLGATGFGTPEEAALASWEAVSLPRVIRTKLVAPDHAEVLVDTEPSHPMIVYCQRENGQWFVTDDVTA